MKLLGQCRRPFKSILPTYMFVSETTPYSTMVIGNLRLYAVVLSTDVWRLSALVPFMSLKANTMTIQSAPHHQHLLCRLPYVFCLKITLVLSRNHIAPSCPHRLHLLTTWHLYLKMRLKRQSLSLPPQMYGHRHRQVQQAPTFQDHRHP